MISTTRWLGWAGAAALLGSAAPAAARVPFSAAPPQNPIQAKYMDFVDEAGGLACKVKGKLAELQGAPNDCYLDLDECKPSREAVGGTLDPGLAELFADLLVIAPGDAFGFAYACPGGDDGPQYLEGLAMQGLGYAKADQYLDRLLTLASAETLTKFTGANNRDHLVHALLNMGPKHKDAVVPALANLVKADAKTLHFKEVALEGLARYESDAAVDYCLEQLKTGESKSLHPACVAYLGERRAKAAVPVLLGAYEKEREAVARALGLIGDAAAVAALEERVADQGARVTVPEVVALVNLGKGKVYMPCLLLLLEGKTPLSEKDEAKKKEDIAKAKKPAQKKKAQEKWAEKEGRVDDQLARAAAIEAAWLTGAADVKAATAVLQKQAKISDPKLWKMWVHANLALAMRGDKAAIGKVAKLIGDPKEDIRKEVIQAIGASYDMPGATARGVADVHAPAVGAQRRRRGRAALEGRRAE